MKPGRPTKDSAVARSNNAKVAPPGDDDIAITSDSDQREFSRPCLGHHLHRVTHLVVGLVGGAGVERDLVTVDGQPTVADLPEGFAGAVIEDPKLGGPLPS